MKNRAPRPITSLLALYFASACASAKVKQDEDSAKAANLCEAGRTDNRLSCETARDDLMHAQNKGDFAFTIDHPFTNQSDFEVTWTALIGEYTYTFYQADDTGCTGPAAGFGSVRSLRTAVVNAAMTEDGLYFFCVFADSEKYPTIAPKNNGFKMKLDTVAPEAPKVDGVPYTNDAQPKWHWTSTDETGAGIYRVGLGDEEFSEAGEELKATEWQPASPLADGQYFVFVQERDEAGNWSESGVYDTIIDTAPPKAEWKQVQDPQATDKLHAVLTFSEPVSGFDKSDIELSAGTIVAISGDGTQYTISLTSSAEEPTIEIVAGGCKDIAGNLNLATEPFVLLNDTPIITP